MSLDGNVCFFVMYHYESNAILVKPISNLDDESFFEAYKDRFDYLESKGFKIQINIMDNQATKQVERFLSKKDCRLQLVEPHNHRLNAAERAIQTFKDHFISGLCTTDVDFPVQLWDQLAPQAHDTLNLMRQSRVDPTKSAYDVLEGPYDWNKYPLAPPGCKAIIHEAAESRASWAPIGMDAWYLPCTHQRTTTDAINSMFQRQEYIKHQDQLNITPNIVLILTFCLLSTSKN